MPSTARGPSVISEVELLATFSMTLTMLFNKFNNLLPSCFLLIVSLDDFIKESSFCPLFPHLHEFFKMICTLRISEVVSQIAASAKSFNSSSPVRSWKILSDRSIPRPFTAVALQQWHGGHHGDGTLRQLIKGGKGGVEGQNWFVECTRDRTWQTGIQWACVVSWCFVQAIPILAWRISQPAILN